MADNTLCLSRGRRITWETIADSKGVVIALTHEGVSRAAMNAVRQFANRRGRSKVYNCVVRGYFRRGKLHLVMNDRMTRLPPEAQIVVTANQIGASIEGFEEPKGNKTRTSRGQNNGFRRPSRRSRNARDRRQEQQIARTYRGKQGNNKRFKGALSAA